MGASGASAFPIQYFGRAWLITLQTQAGGTFTLGSSGATNPLRVVFRVESLITGSTAYWPAEVSLYNLNAGTTSQLSAMGIQGATPGQQIDFNQVIQQGDLLTISAGYQFSASGAFAAQSNQIYQGHVFQPRWTRENVVDTKLTLRCYLGLLQDALNSISFNVSDGATDYAVVNKISTESKIPIANITPEAQQILSQTPNPRGQSFNDTPSVLLGKIANENKLQFWLSPQGINIRTLGLTSGASTPTPVCIYGSPQVPGGATSTDIPGSYNQSVGVPLKQTIIGTPEQTQTGVRFKVLLDAQPKIGDTIQLAPGTIINRIPLVIGQYPSILDQNGLYVIAGIGHYGDTRGRTDDWYTEITALTSNFFPALVIGAPTAPNVN